MAEIGDLQHLAILERGRQRLQDSGVLFRKDKCVLFQPQLEFFCHVILGEGVKVADSKLKTFPGDSNQTRKQQLRSFPGLINYYGIFISQLSTVALPPTTLQHSDVPLK